MVVYDQAETGEAEERERVALDVDPRDSTVAPIRASGSLSKGDDLEKI